MNYFRQVAFVTLFAFCSWLVAINPAMAAESSYPFVYDFSEDAKEIEEIDKRPPKKSIGGAITGATIGGILGALVGLCIAGYICPALAVPALGVGLVVGGIIGACMGYSGRGDVSNDKRKARLQSLENAYNNDLQANEYDKTITSKNEDAASSQLHEDIVNKHNKLRANYDTVIDRMNAGRPTAQDYQRFKQIKAELDAKRSNAWHNQYNSK